MQKQIFLFAWTCVFWCSISFPLDYKIKYSAIYYELEFQNLVSETWTGDVPELGYACIPNPSGRQAGGNEATFEFQPPDFAGLTTSRLAGIKALGECFVLELLQYNSFKTQIWGDAAQVFKASFPSAVNVGDFRGPYCTKKIFFKLDL